MAATPSRHPAKLGLLAFAALAVIALVAWFLSRDGGRASPPPVVNASTSKPADSSSPGTTVVAPVAPGGDERSAVLTEAPVVDAPLDEPAAPVPDPPEKPDLEARDWLTLRIVDELQKPIFDAEVVIRGLRKEGDEGSWYGMRGGETKARSGGDGRARIDYTRWVDIDGKTVRVDLVVSHPDFIPFSETSFVIAPGEQTIELKQGAMVWLAAWQGSRDRRVPEVRIEVEWEAELDQEGWTREPDGRWSTTRLAPGPHWITVTHESAELGKLASDFTAFELAEHARLDLELELKPLVALRGRLDDAVPRPIVDGHVQLNLHASRENLGLSSEHEAVVAADGTFVIEGLRAASGQMIAACDGWVSKLVPPRTLEETRYQVSPDATEAERNETLARARESERIAQPVDVAIGATILVEMEPTGVLEVRVTDEQGAPLADAWVSASPNVHYNGVGSSIFPWHDWYAVTDKDGVARIAQLPPDDNLWFAARGSKHQMRKSERDRSPSAVIVSGQVTRQELMLEQIP